MGSTPDRYRSTSNVKLPIRIIPSVTEVGTTQVQYTITLKTIFHNKLSASDIVLRIPTPLNATDADCKVANGKAKYVPEENVIVWKSVLSFALLALCTSLTTSSHPQQNSQTTRRSRMYPNSHRTLNQYDYAPSLGTTPNRRRFPGVDVHSIRTDSEIFKGI